MTKNKIFEQPLKQENNKDEEILFNFIDELFSEITDKKTDLKSELKPETHIKNKNVVNNNTINSSSINSDTINSHTINSAIINNAILDFGDNCIKINNQRYYIQKYISDTNIVLNRLVIVEDKYDSRQFITKFLNLDKYHFKLLTDSLILYQDVDGYKSILKLFNSNDKIKQYYNFFNCGYFKPNEITAKITSLLKLDQTIKAQSYFTFEVKAKITEYENEIEYEIFEEVLDFLYEIPKEELQIIFKEFIKNDSNYLANCALKGKFKKISLTDDKHTKQIYNI